MRLVFPRFHKTFITDRGRPYYTDAPFVIIPGMLKSSQPIGDDPNLWMALSLTYKFVRYSYLAKNTFCGKFGPFSFEDILWITATIKGLNEDRLIGFFIFRKWMEMDGNGGEMWQAEVPFRLIAFVQASQAFGGTRDRLSAKWGAQQIWSFGYVGHLWPPMATSPGKGFQEIHRVLPLSRHHFRTRHQLEIHRITQYGPYPNLSICHMCGAIHTPCRPWGAILKL